MTRGQSARLKKRFIAEFAKMGNISAACRAVGLHRKVVYEWQEHDERFLLDFHQAEIESTELLEGEAFRRGHDGVTHETPIVHHGEVVTTVVETKYSDTLLIFLLKARNPAKYRDKLTCPHGDASAEGLVEVRPLDYRDGLTVLRPEPDG